MANSAILSLDETGNASTKANGALPEDTSVKKSRSDEIRETLSPRMRLELLAYETEKINDLAMMLIMATDALQSKVEARAIETIAIDVRELAQTLSAEHEAIGSLI